MLVKVTRFQINRAEKTITVRAKKKRQKSRNYWQRIPLRQTVRDGEAVSVGAVAPMMTKKDCGARRNSSLPAQIRLSVVRL
jgi:hypothetical protein